MTSLLIFYFHALEKEMATHSSVFAWRIPGWGSLVGCRLWGRTELDTTEANSGTWDSLRPLTPFFVSGSGRKSQKEGQ